MSDERLREAERRWHETGTVDDEARWLLERVRAAGLSRERLELAAFCGHEAARLACGDGAPTFDPTTLATSGDWPPPPDLAVRWLRQLTTRFGAPPGVVALVALARVVLSAWQRLHPHDDRPRVALDAAERCADDPRREPRGREAFEATAAYVDALQIDPEGSPAWHAVNFAARVCHRANMPDPGLWGVDYLWYEATVAAQPVEPTTLRAGMIAAVVRWALRDPSGSSSSS